MPDTNKIKILFSFWFCFFLISSSIAQEQPNIVLIVADDMGYTDLGVYGSEISTPNLDWLALGGTMLTQMYVTPQCAPTRSALLTGWDNHIAGVGSMFPSDNTVGKPGYERVLSNDLVSLPEALLEVGYHTYMTGKWHLGSEPNQLPTDRGFENFYGILPGAAAHFDLATTNPAIDAKFYDDEELITQLPKDFYSTRSYTDRMISNIEANQDDGKPFFAFMAYTSPHWPLMVPDEYLDRYAGKYDEGYEVLQKRRIANAIKAGVLQENTAGPIDADVGPRWHELSEEEKKHSSRAMEIYAAMVENLDHNIGRLINYLEQSGKLDNTLIIFMSDNGAEGDSSTLNPMFGERITQSYDHSYEMMGKKGSWVSYGAGWASASSAGYRNFKGFTTEGGMRVPAIVSYPGRIPQTVSDNLITVKDIMPTLLDFAGVPVDATRPDDVTVAQNRGYSVADVLTGDNPKNSDACEAWELHGQRAYRCGQWKILWTMKVSGIYWGGEDLGVGRWGLYDLENDPAEMNDLSSRYPDRYEEMITQWEAWAAETNVVLNFGRQLYHGRLLGD